MRLPRVLERRRVLGRRGSVKLGLGWVGRKKNSLSDEEIVRGEGLEGGHVKYAKQARKCDEGRGKFDKVRLEWEDGEREGEDERREEEEVRRCLCWL